jgi:hypothetical protein
LLSGNSFESYYFDRYVVVYFSILYLRYQAGIVNDEMLSLPQKPFLAVGLLEAFGAAAGMAAGGKFLKLMSSVQSLCYRFIVSHIRVYFYTDAYELRLLVH